MIVTAELRGVDWVVRVEPAHRRLARRTLVFSFAPPVLLTMPQAVGFAAEADRACTLGMVIWVSIALLFSAIAIGRLGSPGTVRVTRDAATASILSTRSSVARWHGLAVT